MLVRNGAGDAWQNSALTRVCAAARRGAGPAVLLRAPALGARSEHRLPRHTGRFGRVNRDGPPRPGPTVRDHRFGAERAGINRADRAAVVVSCACLTPDGASRRTLAACPIPSRRARRAGERGEERIRIQGIGAIQVSRPSLNGVGHPRDARKVECPPSRCAMDGPPVTRNLRSINGSLLLQ